MDCLFCKIANKILPANIIYEDDFVMAFYDVSPQAPVHFLVIPKEHISSIDCIDSTNSAILCKIFETISSLATELELKSGYRVVTNSGPDAGQSVDHLHFHVLAGRRLSWPPG